ncbi:MAG: hypothetical protein JWN34_4319 [Bryobacterales bacterium]|nr:hypothetical protein [Bryobacterales bacterium]
MGQSVEFQVPTNAGEQPARFRNLRGRRSLLSDVSQQQSLSSWCDAKNVRPRDFDLSERPLFLIESSTPHLMRSSRGDDA